MASPWKTWRRPGGVPTRLLKRINGVDDTATVRPGALVLVPVGAVSGAGGHVNVIPGDHIRRQSWNQSWSQSWNPGAKAELPLVAIPAKSIASGLDFGRRQQYFYRVQDGDTLYELAGVFGGHVEDLVSWNNVNPDARLMPGMILQVFVEKNFDRRGIVLMEPREVHAVTLGSKAFLELEAARRGRKRLYYTVRKGDTLKRVGKRYGLTPGIWRASICFPTGKT